MDDMHGLVCLTKEVINNGYGEDLLPIDEIDSNNASMVDAIVCKYENKPKRSKTNPNIYHTAKGCNRGVFDQFATGLIKELSKMYKIFDQQRLESKMSHQRHKMMGYPLNYCKMLALILYCNGECNYDLCKSQREHRECKNGHTFIVF